MSTGSDPAAVFPHSSGISCLKVKGQEISTLSRKCQTLALCGNKTKVETQMNLIIWGRLTFSRPFLLWTQSEISSWGCHQSRAITYSDNFLLNIQQCFRASGQLTLMKRLVRTINGSLSTVLRYCTHAWLRFPPLASFSGVSLMKL